MPLKHASPFPGALEEHLDDMKQREDSGSLFYREVLLNASRIYLSDGSETASQQAALELSKTIDLLDNNQKQSSKIRRAAVALRPFLDALSQYVGIADVAIQAGPAAATVAYAGARVLLQLAQDFSNCFGLVLDTLDQIKWLLQGYASFSEAYQHNSEMKQALKNSYKTILDFWQKAAKLFTQKPYKQFFRGIAQPYQKQWNESKQRLLDERMTVQFLAQSKLDLRIQQDKQERLQQALVNWITGPEPRQDVRIHLQQLLALKTEGTCQWLLHNNDVISWQRSTQNGIAWFSGAPGLGKSVATAALVNSLQTQNHKVAYFFCSFYDQLRSCPFTMLRCIIIQLLTFLPDIPDEVKNIYDSERAHFEQYCQNPQIAMQIFHALIRRIGRVHVFIDGLDECKDRTYLISLLRTALNLETYGLVKWFCSSRKEVEFVDLFANLGNVVRVQPSKHECMDDIKTYLASYPEPSSRRETFSELARKSTCGNFLCMSLTAKTLSGDELTCIDDMKDEFSRFPAELNRCYERILRQLMTRSERQRKLASQIFMLVCHSVQPLSMSEIREAVATKSDAVDYSESRMPSVKLVEQLCYPLIELEACEGPMIDPILRPYHSTVKDFFCQDPKVLGVKEDLYSFFTSKKIANRLIGTKCMAYLSYQRYQASVEVGKLVFEPVPCQHSFLKYAAVFWHRHLSSGDHDQELFHQVKSFIQSPNFWTCVKVQRILAPHLFARLVHVDEHRFKMTGDRGGSCRLGDNAYFGNPLPDWIDNYGDPGQLLVQHVGTWVKEWHKILSNPHLPNPHFDPTVAGDANFLAPLHTQEAHARFDIPIHEHRPISNIPPPTEPETIQQTLGGSREHPVKELSFPSNNLTAFATFCFLRRQVKNMVRQRSEGQSPPLFASGARSIEPLHEKVDVDIDVPAISLAHGSSPGGIPLTEWTSSEDEHSESDTLYGDQAASSSNQGPNETLLAAYSYRLNTTPYEQTNDSEATASDEETSDEDEDLPAQIKHYTNEMQPLRRSGTGMSSLDDSQEHLDHLTYAHQKRSSHAPFIEQTHLFVIAQKGMKAVLYHKKSQLPYSFHTNSAQDPLKGVTLWSPSWGQVAFTSFQSAQEKTQTLKVPSRVRSNHGVSIQAVRKEHFVSKSSSTLHILTCTAWRLHTVVIFELVLQSVSLDDLYDTEKASTLSDYVQMISHACALSQEESLLDALIVSWTNDYVYAIIPVLAPSPRVIRFLLPSDTNTPSQAHALVGRIDLPVSTPLRNPVLFVSSHQNKHTDDDATESFELYLDSFRAAPHAQGNGSQQLPPLKISWSASEMGGWRPWDIVQDSKSEDADESSKAFRERLKGGFVDSEKRFKVAVRSGLDWTKKAYLSCW